MQMNNINNQPVFCAELKVTPRFNDLLLSKGLCKSQQEIADLNTHLEKLAENKGTKTDLLILTSTGDSDSSDMVLAKFQDNKYVTGDSMTLYNRNRN